MRRQLDSYYYWFNMSYRRIGLRVLLLDLQLHVLALYNSLWLCFSGNSFNYVAFSY